MILGHFCVEYADNQIAWSYIFLLSKHIIIYTVNGITHYYL